MKQVSWGPPVESLSLSVVHFAVTISFVLGGVY